MNESDFIKFLKDNSNMKNLEGIGDDAALFGEKYLISKDILAEGIHFLNTTPIDKVISKLFTCNVSDIASMGGKSSCVLIGLAVPDENILEPIGKSIIKHACDYGVKIIGGDTSKSENKLFLSMTIIGEKGKNILRRDGAEEGDIIYISRPLGLAKISLEKELGIQNNDIDKFYHYDLKAETEVGMFLGDFKGITCACDISDGLGRDLSDIAVASRLKAFIDMDNICLSYLDQYKVDKKTYFLSSGEEFALLFGVKKDRALAMENAFEKKLGRKPIKIGTFLKGSGCFAKFMGMEEDISSFGFQHFSF